jgi:tetratricopeptide (TPR) repeat protein
VFNELNALQQAIALHQRGQLDEAERAYRHILTQAPRSFNALAFLGTVHLQRGQSESAAALFEQSLSIQSKQPLALTNLGLALQNIGRLVEALKCFERALKLQPDFVDAVFNRAIVLLAMKREHDALLAFRRAFALQPAHLDARLKAAELLHGMSKHDEARTLCDQLIVLAPAMVPAHTLLGNVFFARGQLNEALASYERALAHDASNADAIYNKGLALARQAAHVDALSCFELALQLRPDFVVAALERAAVLRKLKRMDESILAHDVLIERNPHLIAAYCNKASVLQDLNRIDEALACLDVALSLAPDDANVRWNKAVLLLTQGKYSEGWPLYESRWQRPEKRGALERFKKPKWTGHETLTGKTILLHPEQGLGDVIQFARYAPMLAERGARVVLEVQPSLHDLMASLPGVEQVIAYGEPLPRHDFHCPLMSLPAAFETTLESVPAKFPYLCSNPQRQELWRARLRAKTVPRVGLVWSGNTTQANDHNRSMPLACMAPLLDLPLELHALQKDVRGSDEVFLAAHPQIQRWDEQLEDFADTAALIAEMDLVISVCTSVAHLAGALGKPLWMPLCFSADYRWLLEREDSPWYSGARLFRQPEPGDWTSVMQRIEEALRQS